MGRLLLIVAWALTALACPRSAEPAPQAAAQVPAPVADVALGRRLYQRGESPAGEPLRGYLGEERVELAGRAAACANCHHPSGRGTQEGGVAAPDITARALFAPRTGSGEGARPAYDDRSLAAAITRGVSSSGRPLDIAMPRFALPEAELTALLAYLRQLGQEQVPGVTATAVQVGAALPLRGRLAPVGEDVRDVLRAAFADINARGGLYGRRLELQVEDETRVAPGEPDATERLLAAGVLALVGAPASGARAPEVRAALEGVPVLAPLGNPDEEGAGGEAPVFFLYPGAALQARVAVQHLAGEGRAGPWAVVAARSPAGQRWVEGARAEAERRRLPAPLEHTFSPGGLEPAATLAFLREARATAILFHGLSADLRALLAALDAGGDRTPLLAPVQLAAEAPPVGGERVTFVCPTLVGEELEVKGSGFLAFLARHHLRPRHLAFQMSAYASARVLEEALKRAGAAPTREGLTSALESLRGFDTGVAPPLTFGALRRVGVQGGVLVRWSPAAGRLEPVSPWLEAAP